MFFVIFNRHLSCFEFASKFDNATGTNFDPENPLFDRADNLDAKSRNCPVFANWGCFKANFTGGSFPVGWEDSFNKGCSMFELSDDITGCANLNDTVSLDIGTACKLQTSTSLGNTGGMELWQCNLFSLKCGLTSELILDYSCFAEKYFSESDDLFIQISSSLDLVNSILS